MQADKQTGSPQPCCVSGLQTKMERVDSFHSSETVRPQRVVSRRFLKEEVMRVAMVVMITVRPHVRWASDVSHVARSQRPSGGPRE